MHFMHFLTFKTCSLLDGIKLNDATYNHEHKLLTFSKKNRLNMRFELCPLKAFLVTETKSKQYFNLMRED